MEEVKEKVSEEHLDISRLLQSVREEFRRCIQCGKCVGICLAAEVSSFNSRKIIQRVNSGDLEGVLNNDSIWSCVLCSACFAVCPNKINFSTAVMLLRVISFYYGCGWEMDKQGVPFVENYLNTGMTVPEAESPEVMEIFSVRNGTDGTIWELRKRMGLEPKRRISSRALEEISYLAQISGMTDKIALIKKCEKSQNFVEDPLCSQACNEIFKIIGHMPKEKLV
jgi:heterodisulfide reductase subunit C